MESGFSISQQGSLGLTGRVQQGRRHVRWRGAPPVGSGSVRVLAQGQPAPAVTRCSASSVAFGHSAYFRRGSFSSSCSLLLRSVGTVRGLLVSFLEPMY